MRLYPWIGLGGLTFALLALPLFGQNDKPVSPVEPVKTATLPITKVTLFNAGIGHYHREGKVNGPTRVDLKVNEEDINDLILSIVAKDPNGKSQAITYDNKSQGEVTLKGFQIELNEGLGMGNLIQQVRGEKVEITDQNGTVITGQVISVDTPKHKVLPVETMTMTPVSAPASTEGEPHMRMVPGSSSVVIPPPTGAIEAVNLLTDDGLQTLPIARVKKVKFVKPELQAEFRKALEAVANARNASVKSVGVLFGGNGERLVSVGYVAEAPLWKPAYRVVLDGAKPTIIGYAAIENTTDEDWNKVQVKLVSGRPITFQMDLYDPLYVPRPTIEPELYASLRPPMYQGITQGQGQLGGAFGMMGVAQGGQQLGGGGNNLGFGGGFQGGGGGNLGVGGGVLGVNGGGGFSGMGPVTIRGRSKLDYGAFRDRTRPGEGKPTAPMNGDPLDPSHAVNLGEAFEYSVLEPVTLPRFKSAMLPIMNDPIDAKPISVFNPQLHAYHALKGMYLKNSTKYYIAQGPVTVYEGAVAVGQARLPDVKPGESRLLTHAIDLDVLVHQNGVKINKEQLSYRLVDGKLTGKMKVNETTQYAIVNKSDSPRTVWVTQVIRSEWKLITPEKPAETTPNLYRFEVVVPAKTTGKLEVLESREIDGVVERSNDSAPMIEAKIHDPVTTVTPKSQSIQFGSLIEVESKNKTQTFILTNKDSKVHTVEAQGTNTSGWTLVKPQLKAGQLRYSEKIEVPANSLKHFEIVETMESTTHTVLARLSPERIDEVLKLKTLTPGVKAALTQLKTLNSSLAASTVGVQEETTGLAEIEKDQARMRANLERVPKDSEAYKRYLKKFDDQETEIEKRSAKLKEHQKAIVKLNSDIAVFVKNLTAE